MKDLDVLMEELQQISQEILPWYGFEKVKGERLDIWTKGTEGKNVFDISTDGLHFYVKEHEVIKEAKPTIKKIQNKLKEIELWWKLNKDTE